jgi:hypothetical protein
MTARLSTIPKEKNGLCFPLLRSSRPPLSYVGTAPKVQEDVRFTGEKMKKILLFNK